MLRYQRELRKIVTGYLIVASVIGVAVGFAVWKVMNP